MRFLTPGFPGVWRGGILGLFAAGVMIAVAAPASFAADVLFPQPLHLTRRIEDPVSRADVTVHEYCAGNQIVTVSGDKVSIVDYARQELTEIDRAAGEYSVTRFDELARAIPAPAAPKRTATTNAAPSERWKTTPLGVRSSRAGRSLESYEIVTNDDAPGEKVKIELGIDRNVRLSKSAVEALIGATFPNPRREEHEAILRAASPDRGQRRNVEANSAGAAAAPAAADYALPVEQTITVEVEDQTVVLRNTIVDVRAELPPDDVKAIPPGARQVESRAVRLTREMRELDLLTPPTP